LGSLQAAEKTTPHTFTFRLLKEETMAKTWRRGQQMHCDLFKISLKPLLRGGRYVRQPKLQDS
jgi:hypothetical protein